jgi:putative ABC transport system permease protein
VLRVRGLPRPVLLSLRNAFRRKGRLFLTMGTLIVAGTLFISVMGVRASLMAETDNILDVWFDYEIMLNLDGDYHSDGIERRAGSLPGVMRAEGRTGVQGQRIKPDGTEGATFPIDGLSPGTDFIHPTLLSGRWLQKGDRKALVLGSSLVEDMPDVRVGDEMTVKIRGQEYEWEVVGIAYMPFEPSAWADFDYVSSIAGVPGQASWMLVRIEDKGGESQSEMAAALEDRLKEGGVRVEQSTTVDTLSSSWKGQFEFLVSFLMAMAAMTALIGALGLAGMMSLNVMERTREIGIMRSIGAANTMIAGVVLTEGLFIGILSWALAIPISLPMNLLLNSMIGQMVFRQPLAFVFTPSGLAIWLAIIVVISIVASLLPAFRATRMSVRETLAYE